MLKDDVLVEVSGGVLVEDVMLEIGSKYYIKIVLIA
jgi:hypothetical protein